MKDKEQGSVKERQGGKKIKAELEKGKQAGKGRG